MKQPPVYILGGAQSDFARNWAREGKHFVNVMSEIVTAGILVIGDEILSGRTKDKNIGFIAEYLTNIGIDLKEVRVVADDEGDIVAALNALRAAQTFEDQKRGTLDAMSYAARVGVTTSADMGVFVIPGTPDVQDSFTFDTLASGNPFRMYDAFLALHREHRMSMRLRIFYLTMDKDNSIPLLTERVLNSFPEFGDDMMRVSGIGEFATNWPLFGTVTPPPNYLTALQFVAKHGWAFQQHSLSPAEDELTVATFEAVNATTPIAAPLIWNE